MADTDRIEIGVGWVAQVEEDTPIGTVKAHWSWAAIEGSSLQQRVLQVPAS